jgi:hypothetical protein
MVYKKYTGAAIKDFLKVKYADILPAAQAVALLLVQACGHFGERHFADTFGKKVNIIFNREGLLLEDYDDGDAVDYGQITNKLLAGLVATAKVFF